MRSLSPALALLVILVGPALAQQGAAVPSAGQAAQRERMKTCNADAGTQKLTGDARKSFMTDCLAGKSAAAPAKTLTPQQEKMKSCNADASSKKLAGKERRTFMSTCLKG
ncbi:PsiF family protein [Methylobacterium nigriterrae]|uniref:PsiF family protein n=1 Tax=Methylobacterium nigriterrae TaxID=3127512 RepID=UPI003013EEBB